jgi:heat shock protein HtpX
MRERVGPLGIGVLAVGFVAISAATILFVSRLAFGTHVVRRAGARPPTAEEDARTAHMISDVAVGVGCAEPRLWIVDDPAVNALATGRPTDPRVVLTSGAFDCPEHELEMLCTHTVVAGSQSAGFLAGAAAAVLLDADWCTRVIWGVAVLVFLSAMAGIPVDVVAVTFLGIIVLVLATKPLVLISSRALVRLLDCAAELADLETVRITNQPKALATLMLDIVEHREPVTTRWDIAHLWFDPETITRATSLWYPTVRALAGPDSQRTRADLVERARVLVDLADGDAQLRARLDRAARTLAPRVS